MSTTLPVLIIVAILVGLLHDAHAQTFDERKFNTLIEKLESDLLEFKEQIEDIYATRCENFQSNACYQGNYDECQTLYPNQQCLSGENYILPQVCGDPTSCSSLVDFSVSNVRINSNLVSGENNNPTDPQVIETVCYTQALDQWLQDKRAEDASYWADLGVEPWAWYFGSHTGVFRFWPARQSETCGTYDPRVRPWYVAASSGPKNVIMVLDTSRSMIGLRLTLVKEAALRIVNTLTVSDRIAIVPFADDAANPITDENGNMFIVTKENKEILAEGIANLTADGRTNMYDAFRTAFDILDQSSEEEFTVNCNTAILFLTDGLLNTPDESITEQAVLDMVNMRMQTSHKKLNKPILFFTYSVSEDEDVHDFPSKLACSTEYGVWSKITADENIVDNLSSYYRLFALGLSADEDFVAWIEPYSTYPKEFILIHSRFCFLIVSISCRVFYRPILGDNGIGPNL